MSGGLDKGQASGGSLGTWKLGRSFLLGDRKMSRMAFEGHLFPLMPCL